MNQAKADTFVETQIVEQGQLEPKLVEQSKPEPLVVEQSKQEPLVVEPPAKPVDLTTESSDGG